MFGKTTIQRGYRVKLYPTDAQHDDFYRHAGYARFAYNWALARMMEIHAETGKLAHWMEIKKQWNAVKYHEYEWTAELCQRPAEEAIRDLGKAANCFWKALERNGKRPASSRDKRWPKLAAKYNEYTANLFTLEGVPRFKTRRSRRAFRLYGYTVERSRIKLPHFGWVKFRQPGYVPTRGVKYLGVTVYERAGNWFAVVLVEEQKRITTATGAPVGIDLGVKEMAVTSDGEHDAYYANPRALEMYQRRLRRLQRKAARQEKGSANWRKTQRRVAHTHYRIAEIRRWHTHNASAAIIGRGERARNRPAFVAVEDLNVKGMVKNRRLARSVHDANMSELRRQLEYKAAWEGVQFIVIDQWYPSSKTCSNCGARREELTLSERTFICPDCGFRHDRDANAARNLLRQGLNGSSG